MKKIICALLTAALIVPAVSFAQTSNGPVTRAQVRAELVQLENAGYRPATKQIHYPDEIQAAEARVQAADNAYASHNGAPANTAAAAPASMPVVSAN
ncbi:purine nucleoside phosphorylase [Caballeronia udeis]|uniref:Purine nucleoside phosphorylase n=1 Tax=Caballeronia udeis TaxID=1232866 RepID=A0A158HU04_9BURK|nr:DUF4148 domain-containing protein [Caballeronia udeis]SAL47563.1 purine nucleoside phosphorylase [Caballeronia udeis]